MHQWEFLLDLPRRLDERDGVIVVLLDAGGDGENIRIENYIFGREAHFFRQQLVGALANLDLALDGFRLALLVKGHDNDSRAVTQNLARLLEKRPLTFLEADG